ncbi:hypothetical protein [Serinicoccus kebangsaanensis]|uniref:hypothetical protein n=1 Tax=Serinicoccus kebangsaanensis TaxID=2602069 RepID=UPI00124F29C2|nr:hypothetical protein [Serinicoccus kebangsaanensis]
MTAADWVLIVIPLVLILVGGGLLLSGRAAHREAMRLRGGFGGPPGTADIGSQEGFGADPEQHRRALLEARRRVLRGGVVAAVGGIWLVVAVLVRTL